MPRVTQAVPRVRRRRACDVSATPLGPTRAGAERARTGSRDRSRSRKRRSSGSAPSMPRPSQPRSRRRWRPSAPRVPQATPGYDAGMTDITTSHSIDIAAPPERVWEALTTSEQISEWFFGVDTDSDWQVGSTLVHRGEYQGRPYEDRGEILELDPPKRFVHTHWSPMSGLPDTRENEQRVTWTLEPVDDLTTLT